MTAGTTFSPPTSGYLEWLSKQAVKDDKTALGELNRVYPTHQRDYSLTFVNKRGEKSRFSPFELGLNVRVNKRGQVEYCNDDNRAVIIDTRTSIRVKARDADTIAKALLLAKQRFGVEGFDITNATVVDRKAIQQAVNQTKTNVTLKEDKSTSMIERG
ncbi:MAG: LPD7 domain-containing protein [Ostreibacterium sp.]